MSCYTDGFYINTSVSKLKAILQNAKSKGEMRFVICVTNGTLSACNAASGIHGDIKSEADYYGKTTIHGYAVFDEFLGEPRYRYRVSASSKGGDDFGDLSYEERHDNDFIRRMEKYGFERSDHSFDCEW